MDEDDSDYENEPDNDNNLEAVSITYFSPTCYNQLNLSFRCEKYPSATLLSKIMFALITTPLCPHPTIGNISIK